MPILQVYISDDDLQNLLAIADELCRKPEELAEAAVAEEISKYARDEPSRPGGQSGT